MSNRAHILILAGAIATGQAALADDEIVWRIDERQVPIPAGASESLRASIAASTESLGVRMPVPASEEEWSAAQSARDTTAGDQALQSAAAAGVTVEQDDIDGVYVYRLRPAEIRPENGHRLFLYVHGGAYVFGGGASSIGEAVTISSRLGIESLSVDYRMPPAHPFPAAVDDVVTVWRDLLKTRDPGTIALGGTSAGGGLALAAVHRFIQLGLPVPGAIYGGTAWADLTKTGDTLFTNEGLDRVLYRYEGTLEAAAKLYANGHDMTDPLISPVYGDFAGFPPTILVTGTRDMFLSDVARTHRKLRAAGVVSDLHVYEGMSHAGYAFVLDSPESIDTYREIDAFVSAHLR
jgi:acetyl esterase/lipase